MNGRFCRIPAGVVMPVVIPAWPADRPQAGMEDINLWIPACAGMTAEAGFRPACMVSHDPVVYSDRMLCSLSYMQKRGYLRTSPCTKMPPPPRPYAERAARDTRSEATARKGRRRRSMEHRGSARQPLRSSLNTPQKARGWASGAMWGEA